MSDRRLRNSATSRTSRPGAFLVLGAALVLLVGGCPGLVDDPGATEDQATRPESTEGPMGPEGPTGPEGPAGPPGSIGPEGPEGPEGPRGPEGSVGPEGPEGSVGASPFELSGTDVIYTAGNVGIGTLTPDHTLHVVGDGSRTAYFENQAETGNTFAVYGSSVSRDGTGVQGVHQDTGNFGALGRFYEGVYGESASPASGIGVHGRWTGTLPGYGFGGAFTTTSHLGAGVLASNEAEEPGGIGVLGIHQGTSGAGYGVWGQTESALGFAGYFLGGRNYFEGDVGIGTDEPGAKLHVAGRITVDAGRSIWFGRTGNATISEDSGSLELLAGNDILIRPYSDIFMDDDTLVVDGSTNRVGVGTDTPEETLDVRGNVRTTREYTYSSERTCYLQLPVSAFQRSRTDEDDVFVITHLGGYVASGLPPIRIVLYAPVHLPDDAIVREFRVYFYDNDADNDLEILAHLTRDDVTTLGVTFMAELFTSTSEASTDIQSDGDDEIVASTIDCSTCRYTATVVFEPDGSSDDMQFKGCRIEYTVSKAGP